jgi:hypothetical protein
MYQPGTPNLIAAIARAMRMPRVARTARCLVSDDTAGVIYRLSYKK